MANIPDIVTAVVESLPQRGAVTLASTQIDQRTTKKATTRTSRIAKKSSQSSRHPSPGSSGLNREVSPSSEPEENSDDDTDNEEFVLDGLPEGDAISHITQLNSHSHSDDLISINSSDSYPTCKSEKLQPPVLISNGLPSVPATLIKRVEQGLFIEMAELSPSYLDSAELITGNQHGSRKQLPKVSDIVEWVQCFGIYVAIMSHSKPKRVADLIGYQSLIIGASHNCREGQWIIYDRCFCLKASASHTKQWSTVDITIWNMTFPDRAIKSHYPPGVIPQGLPNPSPSHHPARQHQFPTTKIKPICLDWNDNPNGCTRAACRYDHTFY